ncbi:MAG: LysM peptidoglycan-binding domain-containing protein [Candidatus Omnitrophica bacterium]|nr:LysM peptidoglycan-binding domain-containing protein [Candidatus Omnitrophota bacterium]
MKNLILCCILLVMFIFSGCVMRTYTTEMDRVDQEIYGNRGVIMGTPPAVEETTRVRKTRTIYNVEVEVPSAYKPRGEEKIKINDKELYGNRGYMQGSLSPEKEVYVSNGREEKVSTATRLSGGMSSAKMPQIVYSEPSSSSGSGNAVQKEYYVVQKGDTLQKISQKVFGTTQKWTSIYEANKHVLKSPDRIRPGQKLVIPK